MFTLVFLFLNSITTTASALEPIYSSPSPIIDSQRIVSPANLTKYNYYLKQLYEKDKVKANVIVIDRLTQPDFKKFSLDSYYGLNLGDDRDNGILMIVVVREGKIAIVSGKNIEFPESKKEKISKEMKSLLKDGKMESALLLGTNRIIEKTTKNKDLFNNAKNRAHDSDFNLSFVLATFALVYFLIALFFQRILWGRVFIDMLYRWKPGKKKGSPESFRTY